MSQYDGYVEECVKAQAQKEAVLSRTEPVKLDEQEKVRFAAWLRRQAALARKAFDQGGAPPQDSFAFELAKGVHDGWVAGKSRDGWSYAKVRDDERKEHPLMKPAEELTFGEFRWDIDTAISTMIDMAQGLNPL